jgi:hypothetical protein
MLHQLRGVLTYMTQVSKSTKFSIFPLGWY